MIWLITLGLGVAGVICAWKGGDREAIILSTGAVIVWVQGETCRRLDRLIALGDVLANPPVHFDQKTGKVTRL